MQPFSTRTVDHFPVIFIRLAPDSDNGESGVADRVLHFLKGRFPVVLWRDIGETLAAVLTNIEIGSFATIVEVNSHIGSAAERVFNLLDSVLLFHRVLLVCGFLNCLYYSTIASVCQVLL